MRLLRIVVASLILVSHPAMAAEDPPSADANARLYDEAADASKQISEALREARSQNQRVLIQWGANWCGWCHRLNHHFTETAEVRRTLMYEYVVVKVDVGRFDKHMDIAERYGAALKTGIPYITVLGGDGSVIANQETGSLEDGQGHDAAKVNEFLTTHQAPRQDAEVVLASAIEAAGTYKRRVFLHFGAPWCGWCHRFEDWMETEEVARELRLDFIMCKIDIDRMTNGKEVLARYTGGKQTGIPFFAFLDSDGEVMLDSMVPRGNLGCPWERDEVQQFKGMLNTVCENIPLYRRNAIVDVLHSMRDEQRKKDKARRAAEAAKAAEAENATDG